MWVHKQGPRRETYILHSKYTEVTACEKMNKKHLYLSKEMCVYKQGPRR